MKQPLLFVSILILLSACDKKVRMEANGYTQGTTYSVIYFNDGADYQYQIDSLLLAFDRVLSTYQESSYISKWNRNEVENVDQPTMFREVVQRAKEVYVQTDGSFDITVSPLMKFWFDRNWNTIRLDSSEVDSIMTFVGMKKVLESSGTYTKSEPSVQLDVNAIAQGYSVDVLSRFLESKGVFNYLVEIGGEVSASGAKAAKEPWKVGIDKPTDHNLERELALTVELKDKSLATSGNYRKFIEVNGQKLGHAIDPKSGYPATTDILSATVIASDCMTADAFATAFLTLGFEKARKLIEESEELEGVLIYSDNDEVRTWNSLDEEVVSE